MPLITFDDPDLIPDAELTQAAVLGKLIEGTLDWTDDEVAFQRILRLVPAAAAAKLAGDLVHAALHGPMSGHIIHFAGLARDGTALVVIQKRGDCSRKVRSI